MSAICVADNDSSSIKQPQPVRPGSDVMNSVTFIANAFGPTKKLALKVTKDGHIGNARCSVISTSFKDSENEIIEVRARGPCQRAPQEARWTSKTTRRAERRAIKMREDDGSSRRA